MANDAELSIEQTNKLRISLGLKPLRVESTSATSGDPDSGAPPAPSFEDKDREAVDNWHKYQSEIDKEQARKKKADAIKKARDAAQRFRKLEGATLADEEETEDTTSWVKKLKKRQKKQAEKLALEKEEELKRLASERQEYTGKNLQGIKVAHDMADVADGGGETILTLKDATIEENEEEGDELISTELAERERLREKLELKKKKPVYNAYDDDIDENGERRLLSQYDEEIDGKKKKRFVLDGTGTAADSETHRQKVAEQLKSKIVSLDLPQPEIPSDYVNASTIKVKKPKKGKKSTRKHRVDEEDTLAPREAAQNDNDTMQIDDEADSAPARAPNKKRRADDANYVDDDDLQAVLAIQRRTALKKRKIMKPADIARQMREESLNEGSVTPNIKMEVDEEEPGLVIDETSEFVNTLHTPVLSDRKTRQASTSLAPVTSMADGSEDEEGDANMIRDERSLSVNRELEGDSLQTEISTTGLEEETTINRGVGSTLAMLTQRGHIKRDPESEKRMHLHRERERFRSEKRFKEQEAEQRAKEARLRDRQSGKFDRMSAREREEHARWENKNRDMLEAKEMQARFKNYKPDVNLSYKDEFGREMSQKEAFKFLSHQFHGKGSGKAKTEKRLKKIEDEKKREAASALNSAASDVAAMSAAKKSKHAGVRLA